MKSFGLILLLLPLLTNASGQDLLLEEKQYAQPIERVPPKYPVSAARAGKEGWVKLDLVVDKDGQVSDAVVLDSSGVSGFERAALRAIKKWRYEPALLDGKPVEQCYKVQLDFAMQGRDIAVTRRFASKIRTIQKLLDNKELDAAKVQLQELREQPKWNLTEDAWYWMVESLYQEYKGETDKQIASLWRAAGGAGSRLPAEQSRYVLYKLFVLQTNQNKFAAALESFEKLQKIEGSEDTVKGLAPYVDKIHQIVEGDQQLIVQAGINERRQWYHRLSRSGFELADIKGELDSVEIRCERQLSTYKAVSDSVWKIPNAWGQCKVLVKGEPGSEFKLVELQLASDSEQTAAL